MRLSLLTVPLAVAALGIPSETTAQDYYSDIRPALVENCTGCHSKSGIAWSMEDAEETFAERRRIAGASRCPASAARGPVARYSRH